MIVVNEQVSVPASELSFDYSTSSGPGGQNVNKVSTRVTLRFAVPTSPSLSDQQKELIRDRLATRINKQGVLRVISQRHRTRGANQKAAIERFAELLAAALHEDPERLPTRTPEFVRRRRLANKHHRSRVKQTRGPPGWDE